jgi:small subunit ribosomal protein S8
MSIDSIGNFLTVVRNGIMASKPFVLAPCSKMNYEIARILKQEGFVADLEKIETEEKGQKLKVVLKYVDGESAIHAIDRVSKPSRRVYTGVKNIKPVIGGLGISILSTNRGIITDKQAKSEKCLVGGEVICTVW